MARGGPEGAAALVDLAALVVAAVAVREGV
jgi:hypothetical protein